MFLLDFRKPSLHLWILLISLLVFIWPLSCFGDRIWCAQALTALGTGRGREWRRRRRRRRGEERGRERREGVHVLMRDLWGTFILRRLRRLIMRAAASYSVDLVTVAGCVYKVFLTNPPIFKISRNKHPAIPASRCQTRPHIIRVRIAATLIELRCVCPH